MLELATWHSRAQPSATLLFQASVLPDEPVSLGPRAESGLVSLGISECQCGLSCPWRGSLGGVQECRQTGRQECRNAGRQAGRQDVEKAHGLSQACTAAGHTQALTGERERGEPSAYEALTLSHL